MPPITKLGLVEGKAYTFETTDGTMYEDYTFAGYLPQEDGIMIRRGFMSVGIADWELAAVHNEFGTIEVSEYDD